MFRRIKALARLFRYPYIKECLLGVRRGWFPVFIRYPVKPVPRYGYGLAPHSQIYEMLDKNRDSYQLWLENFRQYEEYFLKIKTNEMDNSQMPYWSNPWFTGLDAIALYSFIAIKKPRIYLEIGSGNSSKFAKKAILDHELDTEIISIDPHPRANIDAISDIVIRQPLEDVDLNTFNALDAGDILFIDSSHRCFMNSDVTVFFLDLLPKVSPGVFIHIHDIYLPYDYPPRRAHQYESEQYLLAAMLLAEGSRFEILLPNNFVVDDDQLNSILDSLWNAKSVKIPNDGVSFWMVKRKY